MSTFGHSLIFLTSLLACDPISNLLHLDVTLQGIMAILLLKRPVLSPLSDVLLCASDWTSICPVEFLLPLSLNVPLISNAPRAAWIMMIMLRSLQWPPLMSCQICQMAHWGSVFPSMHLQPASPDLTYYLQSKVFTHFVITMVVAHQCKADTRQYNKQPTQGT